MKKNIIIAVLVVVVTAAILTFVYFAFFATLNINSGSQADLSTIEAGYNSGNLDQSIADAERLAAEDQTNIAVLLGLAVSYAQKGSVAFQEENYGQKAIDTANKVLTLDPYNSEAFRVIGYAYEIMQQYQSAHENYDKAIELDEENSQAHSNKGHAYDLQGNLTQAAIWYDKALSLDASNEHALLNKARLLIRQSKLEDAKAVIGKLGTSSRNQRFLAEGYQLLSFIYLNQPEPNYELALSAIQSAISNDPNVPQAYVTLATVKMRTLLELETEEEIAAQMKEVHAAIDKALEINPNQASAYYLAYRMAQVEDQPVVAAEMKQKALAAIPADITLGIAEKAELKSVIETTFSDVTSKEI